jgi:hypothetical protein
VRTDKASAAGDEHAFFLEGAAVEFSPIGYRGHIRNVILGFRGIDDSESEIFAG